MKYQYGLRPDISLLAYGEERRVSFNEVARLTENIRRGESDDGNN